MDHLLTVIVTWLSLSFGLPAHYDHPTIAFLPEEALHGVHYGPAYSREDARVVAVYDEARSKILLTRNWKVTSPADVSVLVHEMVHHLQRNAGMTYGCPAAGEKLAYTAQAEWLEQFGTSLEREFELDAFTLKVMTTCPLP